MHQGKLVFSQLMAYMPLDIQRGSSIRPGQRVALGSEGAQGNRGHS